MYTMYDYFEKLDNLREIVIKGLNENDSEVIEDTVGRTMGTIPHTYNSVMLYELYKMSNTNRRCIDTLVGYIFNKGWKLVPLSKEAEVEQRDEINSFFENMPFDFIDVLSKKETDLKIFGYSAIEIMRDGKDFKSKDIAINHIPARDFYLTYNKDVALQNIRGKKVYYKRYNASIDVNKLTGEISKLGSLDEDLVANEFYVERNYNPNSTDTYGLPVSITILDNIIGNSYAMNYNLSYFKHFGMPGGVVKLTGNYEPSEVVPEIEKQLKGFIEKPHRVALFAANSRRDGGMDSGDVKIDFEKFNSETQDSSFENFYRQNIEEISSGYGVPLYLIGNNSQKGSLGGSNSESSFDIFRDTVITVRQNVIERFIQGFIYERFGYNETQWQFKFNSLDVEDEEANLDMFLKIMEHGGASVRDLVRNFGEKFGLEIAEDDEIGDMRFIGKDIIEDDFRMTLRKELNGLSVNREEE